MQDYLSPIPPPPCLIPPYPTHSIPKMKKKTTMRLGIQVVMNKTLTPKNIVAPFFGRQLYYFKTTLVNLRTTD